MKSLRAALLASAVLLLASTPLFSGEAAHWNRVAVDATSRALPLDPMSESRILAIVHLAMHDALNATNPRFHGYGPASAGHQGGSAEAAVAAAAHAALGDLLPAHRAEFDAELTRRLVAIADGPAKDRGLAAGREAARWLLEARREDGAARESAYQPGEGPGDYRPTPPDFTPAVKSHWGRVRPFALRTSEQFRPVPPPVVDGAQARLDLAEVRLLGGADSAVRTHEQSEIACYWYENSTVGWNRIAHDIAVARGLDVWEEARLLALVNVALADGFIGGFEAKYHYNYWRPATAIRANGHPGWLSHLFTPPVPDYPSTHTVLGAAAATAIARCLGTDLVPFAMTSGAPYSGITRRFWSLSQAARENGASRVFAGLHFTSAVNAGYQQGAAIGDWAAAEILRPLGTEPRLAGSNP